MFKNYTDEELKKMPNGLYTCKYDPDVIYEFWPPEDEQLMLYNGQLICLQTGIGIGIENMRTKLEKFDTAGRKIKIV